ncbi:hypothetical protein HKX48_006784 [Thoreauomyces humboldtii]|nr:hypothetical protein HKX48_006784 [Thoreauomyces humboldtii]
MCGGAAVNQLALLEEKDVYVKSSDEDLEVRQALTRHHLGFLVGEKLLSADASRRRYPMLHRKMWENTVKKSAMATPLDAATFSVWLSYV